MNRPLASLVALAVISAVAQAGPGDSPATATAPATAPAVRVGLTSLKAAKADAPYKLYIPLGFDKQPERLLPLVINHNPGGNTRLGPYQAWADEQGVILVGIDKVSNGLPTHEKPALQDAVLADLAARGVRAHPLLRFTIGMSGGSADGLRLIRRGPAKFAGAVIMGAGGVLDAAAGRHLAYAILGGAKDEWMSGEACLANAEKAKALGAPLLVRIDVDRQHREAPIDQQLYALSWLIEVQKLRMPTLGEQERKANLAAAAERMHKAVAIADANDLAKQGRLLLDLEPLTAFRQDRDALAEAWAKAIVTLARAEKDAPARHAMLCDRGLLLPRTAALPARATRIMQDYADELRKDPAVAADWAIRERFAALEAEEIAAGLRPDKLEKLLPGWAALAKSAAGTVWEAKVARRIRICKTFVERPSTIQSPTRVVE